MTTFGEKSRGLSRAGETMEILPFVWGRQGSEFIMLF